MKYKVSPNVPQKGRCYLCNEPQSDTVIEVQINDFRGDDDTYKIHKSCLGQQDFHDFVVELLIPRKTLFHQCRKLKSRITELENALKEIHEHTTAYKKNCHPNQCVDFVDVVTTKALRGMG